MNMLWLILQLTWMVITSQKKFFRIIQSLSWTLQCHIRFMLHAHITDDVKWNASYYLFVENADLSAISLPLVCFRTLIPFVKGNTGISAH